MSAQAVAPFQYPGGKYLVAGKVWDALGDPPRYIEPFAGSLGVLLARPGERDGFGEIINDANGHIVNVWRAIRRAPDEVAWWLAGPATTADLNARHAWTHTEGAELVAAVFTDADHYDAKAAAWYIYGLAFAAHPRAFMQATGQPGRCAKNHGNGPHANWRQPIDAYLQRIAERLSRATIFAGDWSDCVTPAVLRSANGAPIGVFLDPPYGTDRQADLYGVDTYEIAAQTNQWCLTNGADRQLRIVLAGYDGEHNNLERHGWQVAAWSSQTGGESRHAERLWTSPHCNKQEVLL